MNRLVTYFNFLGIVALAILCMIQWEADSRLNSQLNATNRIRLEQAGRLNEQDATLEQNSTDLADLRQRLALAESDLKDNGQKLDAANERRDQLKSELDKSVAACTTRDQEIGQASDEIKKLAGERDDAIHKFNDLADKYNALIKQMNGKG